MSPETVLIWVTSIFGLAIVGAILLYVLDIFWNGTTGIFSSGTYAANFTQKMSQATYNVAEQAPNAGKLAGVLLILGVVALMGVGAYMGYQKVKGM